jgi:hypothetical protein
MKDVMKKQFEPDPFSSLGSAIMEKMKTPSGEQKLKDEQTAKQAVNNTAPEFDARVQAMIAAGERLAANNDGYAVTDAPSNYLDTSNADPSATNPSSNVDLPKDESGATQLVGQFDLSTRDGKESYLNAVAFAALEVTTGLNGVPTLSKSDSLIAADILTKNFGYAQGTNTGTLDELLGKDGLQSSLTKYVQTQSTHPDDNNLRYAFFTEGKVTRGDRFVKFSFTNDSSEMANQMGISKYEARAKIDWDVYKKVINAAFDTSGVKSIEFSGGWRPTAKDLIAAFGITSAREMAGQAGLSRKLDWGSGHSSGNSVDIGSINGKPINNGGYDSNNMPKQAESALMKEFTKNLRAEQFRQVFQPWEMYNLSKSVLRYDNTFDKIGGNNWRHRNHLHVGL